MKIVIQRVKRAQVSIDQQLRSSCAAVLDKASCS